MHGSVSISPRLTLSSTLVSGREAGAGICSASGCLSALVAVGVKPGGVAPSVSTSACSAVGVRIPERLSWSAGDGVRTAAGPCTVGVTGAQPGAGAASCPGLRGIFFLGIFFD